MQISPSRWVDKTTVGGKNSGDWWAIMTVHPNQARSVEYGFTLCYFTHHFKQTTIKAPAATFRQRANIQCNCPSFSTLACHWALRTHERTRRRADSVVTVHIINTRLLDNSWLFASDLDDSPLLWPWQSEGQERVDNQCRQEIKFISNLTGSSTCHAASVFLHKRCNISGSVSGFRGTRKEDHSTPLQLLTSPGPYKQNTENLLKYAHMINGCLLFQLGLIIQILLKPLIPLKTQTQW